MTAVRTLVPLPEGAMPLDVVEVCGYLDADGERRYAIRCTTDAPLSTTLGLLVIAQHRLIHQAEEFPT